MIETRTGDLFEADVEAFVNSVNCAGVMGRGLARQFKERFPENLRAYKDACRADDLAPGRVLVHDRGGLFYDPQESDGPRYILNVATIDHWKDRARLADVQEGIRSAAREVEQRGIRSVAIPAIGCGYGGLAWADVEGAIREAFGSLGDCRTVLFPPSDSEEPAARGSNTQKTRSSGG
jgi:O-acetyl-ADP-ribose deacetylase (regulator of RNase III)